MEFFPKKGHSEIWSVKFFSVLPNSVLNLRPCIHHYGVVHKVRHARGGPRRCDSLWQGGWGFKSMWHHTFQIFSYIWNLKLKVMF